MPRDDEYDKSRALRFSDLEPETQRFLDDLRPEEIAKLKEAIDLVRSIATVAKFVKWMIVGIVGCFMGMYALGDTLIKMKGWFK